MGPVYDIILPPDVQQLLNELSFGISLGLEGSTALLTCGGLQGFLWRLVFWMLVPLVFVGVCLVVSALGLVRTHRDLTLKSLFERALPLIVRILFLMYPIVANAAFEAFSCYDFDEGSYLVADVSVDCWTDEYYATVWVAAWVAIVYVFALVALNGALLFSARRAILKKQPTRLSTAIAFLYKEYLSLIHI